MGTYTCECGREFDHQGGYKTHRKHCEESPIEPDSYFCECGEEFHTKGSLKSHQNSCSESEYESPSWSYSYDKVECPDCGDMIGENQLERHRNSETCKAGGTFETLRDEKLTEYYNTKLSVLNWEVGNNEYKCPECGEIYSKKGIGAHYWRNHTEEGQEFDPNSDYGKNRVAWNKGLTKEDDERIKKQIETFKERIEEGEIDTSKMGGVTEESRKKIKTTIKEKVKNGNWHYSFSKVRTYEYKGYQLHGSWELKFAKWLDEKNISWKRPTQKFEYNFKGETRNYIPDFYLKEKDKFIEIKGYKTEKDEAKWRDFPYNLQVLREQDLRILDII